MPLDGACGAPLRLQSVRMGVQYKHDVSSAHTRHILARGVGQEVSVTDFRCLACRHRMHAEEYNVDPSIVFVRRGVFLRSQGGATLVADASHILFFNPQQPYRISHPIDGGDDCTILTISPALASEVVGRYDPRAAERSPWRPFVHAHARAVLDTWRMHYHLLANLHAGAELALDDLLLSVIDTIVAHSHGNGTELRQKWTSRRARSRTDRRHRELAQGAVVAIHRNLARPPGLAALASGFGCSSYHLSHVFREAVGSSLRSYLATARARAAADALERGARSLTELALRLGYADHSHFTNAFHKEWKVSPSAFRAAVNRGCRRKGAPPVSG